MLAMFDAKTHLGSRGSVRPELVRHHNARRCDGRFQEPPHEPLRSATVSSTLDQDVKNEAVLIDGPPKPVWLSGDRDDDFIQMPFVAPRRSSLAELIGEGFTELLPPPAHRLIGHANSARRKHLLDHAKAKRKSEIMGWTVPAPRGRIDVPTGSGAMTITTIGLDTSKSWFQVHCIDADGRTVLRRKLARSKVLSFFANIPSCLVGLEACGGSHFWARELAKLGHDARLMPARYVRAYVKTNKHDAADAEACCEAVQRPGMRFVPVKTEEQQSMLMIHRARDLLVRQRTAAVNALRGHLAEFGIVAARGTAKAHELMRLAGDDERLPAMAQEALRYIVAQIHDIEIRLKSFEQRILSLAKENEVCKRLMTVQSIGPYIATAIAATVGDPRNFASGRHFAAWLGLTPKQHSTGGKEKLGGISKRGDSYIRRLLIHGARATVARVRSGQTKNAWLSGLLGRRHFNVATVALANKTARVAWAVMSTEQTYRRAA